ncbi:MAG: sigma-70 family RNA polymerase sigma factor [Terriglobales bacterium]
MEPTDEQFESWVRQYSGLLFSIAFWTTGSRSEAEELTQEAFFQAYKSRKSLLDFAKSKSWLCSILRYCYLQSERRLASRPAVPLQETEEWDFPVPEDFSLDARALHQALDRLDKTYRMPLMLFYFEEFSYREIAEILELPIGTVMSRLARGKAALRRMLTAVRPASPKIIGIR